MIIISAHQTASILNRNSNSRGEIPAVPRMTILPRCCKAAEGMLAIRGFVHNGILVLHSPQKKNEHLAVEIKMQRREGGQFTKDLVA